MYEVIRAHADAVMHAHPLCLLMILQISAEYAQQLEFKGENEAALSLYEQAEQGYLAASFAGATALNGNLTRGNSSHLTRGSSSGRAGSFSSSLAAGFIELPYISYLQQATVNYSLIGKPSSLCCEMTALPGIERVVPLTEVSCIQSLMSL